MANTAVIQSAAAIQCSSNTVMFDEEYVHFLQSAI